MRLVFFSTEARIIWSGAVDEDIPSNTWKMQGGMSYLAQALKEAFAIIHQKISYIDTAQLCIFTDGEAAPSQNVISTVAEKITANKEMYIDPKTFSVEKCQSKVNVSLMQPSSEYSECLHLIKSSIEQMFADIGTNEAISGKPVCVI